MGNDRRIIRHDNNVVRGKLNYVYGILYSGAAHGYGFNAFPPVSLKSEFGNDGYLKINIEFKYESRRALKHTHTQSFACITFSSGWFLAFHPVAQHTLTHRNYMYSSTRQYGW